MNTGSRKKSDVATDRPARRMSKQTVFLAAVLVVVGLTLAYFSFFQPGASNASAQGGVSRLRLEDIPFNGERAYEYLKQICAIGRRPSGSPGMAQQQQFLLDHFRKLGAQADLQSFRVPHPVDDSMVPMANLIVQWHPERTERILLCTHYDTLPYPMLDRQNPRGVFVGANDGGSGVALLMELGNEMPGLPTNLGVDFVFLDGEEFIFHERHRYFRGSEYFAQAYANRRLPYQCRYRWGVLLDMIGDADLKLFQERNSMAWRDTRPLVEEIWAIARRLGVYEFVPEKGYEIRDDHLLLHNTGKIPCCDIIDFDYPAWHTQADTPEQCSALSLAKVGWVVREWLKAAR